MAIGLVAVVRLAPGQGAGRSDSNVGTSAEARIEASRFARTGDITGRVVDGESGGPIPGARLTLQGLPIVRASAADGAFRLPQVPAGTYDLAVSALGYEAETVRGVVVGDGSVDLGTIALRVAPIRLDELIVTPGRFAIMGSGPAARQTLTADELKNMSWAEDITRAVTRLPGIGSSDYSSKFTIRGGEANEVLITLDGMELYEPFHQRDYSGGLFSIVDIEAIQGVDLMTGGFPAEYGNRLSGVLTMQAKRSVTGSATTSVGLSPMNARLYADGPFADGRGSYLFSARRGMLDIIFKATGRDESLPVFYDAMGKVDYDLSATQTMSAYFLRAGDRTEVRDIAEDNYDIDDTSYGNTYGWLTLGSFLRPDLSLRTILYTGRISHDRTGAFEKYEPSDKGMLQLSDQRVYTLVGLKQDWKWQASDDVLVSGGLDAKRLSAQYDYFRSLQEVRIDSTETLVDFDRTTESHTDPSGRQVGLYLTARVRVLPRLVAESGLRFDDSSYGRDRVWSPRVGMAYSIGARTVLRGAWGRFYQSQPITDLDVNNGNEAFDPAERAEHWVAGLEHQFAHGVDLRVEVYEKDISRLSPLWQNLRDHLEIFPEARNDNALVFSDGARSRGLELFVKRDRGGRFSWWLSYSLAKAEDRVRDIRFDGLLEKRTGLVPRLNDQRHTVYADLNYRPADGWLVNLSWQYYCCWPRTDYTYRYQALPNGDLHFYPVHLEFNGARYPAYHRLDVRTNRTFRTGRGDITAFLHVVNVYNRQNLKKFDLDTRDESGALSLDAMGNYVPVHDDKYWFGLIPVIGASWTFSGRGR